MYCTTNEEVRAEFQKAYAVLGFYYMCFTEVKEIGKSYYEPWGDFNFTPLREPTEDERKKFYDYNGVSYDVDDDYPYRYIISID